MSLQVKEERELVYRIREAVQFCKKENSFKNFTDHNMKAEDRMIMEKCLVQNYLIKHGMDYFGKRDLIYIDMQGSQDVARLNEKRLAETEEWTLLRLNWLFKLKKQIETQHKALGLFDIAPHIPELLQTVCTYWSRDSRTLNHLQPAIAVKCLRVLFIIEASSMYEKYY